MGNQLDHCKKANSDESELDVRLVEAQRLEKQVAELKNKNRALEQENRELQTLTQELMDSREEAPGGQGQDWEVQVAEAQAQAEDAAAENARLQERLAQLEEHRELQAQQLEETSLELEEHRNSGANAAEDRSTGRELAAVQAERRAWLAEKAELEEALHERKAELDRTGELAQKLQEEHAEAMAKLAALQVSSAPSRDDSGEGLSHALRMEERERLRDQLEAQIGGGQAEIARLRAENRALGSQCQSLAEMAEQACCRAEQARFRFEQAEQAARGRQGGAAGSAVIETAGASVMAAENALGGVRGDFAEVRRHFAAHLPAAAVLAPPAAAEPVAGTATPSQAGSEHHPLSLAASTADAGLRSGLNSGVNTPKPRPLTAALDAAPAPQALLGSGRRVVAAKVLRSEATERREVVPVHRLENAWAGAGAAAAAALATPAPQASSPQSTMGLSSGPPSSVLLVGSPSANVGGLPLPLQRLAPLDAEVPPLPPSPVGCSARIRLPSPGSSRRNGGQASSTGGRSAAMAPREASGGGSHDPRLAAAAGAAAAAAQAAAASVAALNAGRPVPRGADGACNGQRRPLQPAASARPQQLQRPQPQAAPLSAGHLQAAPARPLGSGVHAGHTPLPSAASFQTRMVGARAPSVPLSASLPTMVR